MTIVPNRDSAHATATGRGAAERHGACFMTVIPNAKEPWMPPRHPTATAAPLNILIVDDNAGAARGLARMIEEDDDEGRVAAAVTVIAEPMVALRLVRKLDIDVVIADERMPGMHGSEILATLARLRPHCFRALTTGLVTSTDQLLELINHARVEFVLAKPFSPDTVRDLLRLARNERRCAVRRRTTSCANAWATLERDAGGAIVLPC